MQSKRNSTRWIWVYSNAPTECARFDDAVLLGAPPARPSPPPAAFYALYSAALLEQCVDDLAAFAGV
jgi:hypothetical protein